MAEFDSSMERDRRRREAGNMERSRHSPSPTPSVRNRQMSGGNGNGVLLGGIAAGDKASPGIEIDMSYYAEDSQRGSGSTIIGENGKSRSLLGGGAEAVGIGLGVGPVNGLGVPGGTAVTSRADKRRSINPGMTLNQTSRDEGLNAPVPAKDLSPRGLTSGRSSPSPTADVFVATGKLGTLPPSPLRASFTDADGFKPPVEGRSASPTPKQGTSPLPTSGQSLAPGSIGMSKSTSSRSALGNQSDNELGGLPSSAPPRSSSLTDPAMKIAVSGAGLGSPNAARPTYNPHVRASSSERSTTLTSPTPSARDRSASVGGAAVQDPPRIDAPALPSLNFSLSDPDFAAWLEEKKMSPDKAKRIPEGSRNPNDVAAAQGTSRESEGNAPRSRMKTTAAERVQPLRQQSNGPGSSSLPSSPVSTGTPTAVHSPPLHRIMFGGQNSPAALDAASRPVRSDSLSSVAKGKHSDSEEAATIRYVRPGMPDHALQSSTESVPSVGVLRVPTVESVLPVLQVLADKVDASGVSLSTHEISADLLLKAINEIQALNDQVTVLKDKYSGAKVIRQR